MAQAGEGEARQLPGLDAEQPVALAVAHLLHQPVVQFAHGVQITLIVSVDLADFGHIQTGVVELAQLMNSTVGPVELCLRQVEINGDIAYGKMIVDDFALQSGRDRERHGATSDVE